MKRTILGSTSTAIAALGIFSTMKKEDFVFSGKTAEHYVNSFGEKAYKGTPFLRETQRPGCGLGHVVFGEYGCLRKFTS